VADSPKMIDQTIARLRSYGRGNGIKSEDITPIKSTEEIYTIHGRLTLTPHCEVESQTTTGRMKGKVSKVLSSFAELRGEVDTIKKDFEGAGTWTEGAIKELEATNGHGWGLHGSLLCLGDNKVILGATENCPTCRGTAQHPCHTCGGIGFRPCYECQSLGHERCLQCNGTGQDPMNTAKKCSLCHGTGQMLCRFCQGAMKIPCESCQGRGNTPCTDCNGTGTLSQEVHITKGARMDFVLGATSGLPSGLLRGLSRVGEEKLCAGHADITMKPELGDDPSAPPKGPLVINLEAKIPYADIQLNLCNKPISISCFGKNKKLAGVPAFLDQGLREARKNLTGAVAGRIPLEMALSTRAINDAFSLILSGKTHPNNLRRLYPVGLSGEAAQEIMENLVQLFRRSTMRTRLIVSSVSLVLCLAAFTGLSFSSAFANLATMGGTYLVIPIKILIPMIALSVTWLALQQASKAALRKQLKQAKIAAPQSIGRTGAAALGVILLLYLIILFLSENLI